MLGFQVERQILTCVSTAANICFHHEVEVKVYAASFLYTLQWISEERNLKLILTFDLYIRFLSFCINVFRTQD